MQHDEQVTGYASFRFARRGRISLPHPHELSALTRHHHGVMLLGCMLLFTFHLASIVHSMPVAAQTDLAPDPWMIGGMEQDLVRRYRTEVPQLIGGYLTARGAFAARVADGDVTNSEVVAWVQTVRTMNDGLLARIVAAPHRDIHLGLVLAVGADGAAARQLADADTAEGRTAAVAAFQDAEDRLSSVVQSAPWLIR